MKSLEEIEPRTLISSLPFTIVRAGSYYLTTNLTGVAARNGITITASDVTLDLNGFALVGVPGSQSGIVAAPLSGVLDRVVVRNGVVRNWDAAGVYATLVVNGHFERLHLRGNGMTGLDAGTGSVVESCLAFDNEVGISAREGSIIARCNASRNTEDGIITEADCTISQCVCATNAENGMVTRAGSRILQCIVTRNQNGFVVANGNHGVTIEHSTARTNASVGIYLIDSSYCQIIGNVADGNDVGILVTGAGNRIEDNHTVENRTMGIRVSKVGGRNVIVKNTARNNEGVSFPNDHNYEVAQGNLFGPVITFGTNPDPILGNVYPQNHPWANFGDAPAP